MFNIADLIVVILILLAVFKGYKKGFIKTGLGVLSFFVAIVITFMFYKPVMNFMRENTGFESWFSEYLYNINVGGVEEMDNSTESGDDYISNLPKVVVDIIGLEEVKENVKVTVVEKIVDFTLKLLSIMIVYIIARIILNIVIILLDSIAKLPVLKQFNELLGVLIGAILGVIQVYTVCAVVAVFSSISFMMGIATTINTSMFAHMFYNNNLLLQILF